ncbi:MAG: hypothetical protein L3K16_09635 [Thermoplasmata archaeon]|jgi:hypothetical protein|nr:hypothetical protein [Thermoplasmata archaeon]
MARVRNLPKSRSTVYLARARQYEQQLTVAVEHRRWEAAGLSAVHLVIASVDALTCAKLGKVWGGEDHAGVVDLLRETGGPGVEPVVRQVSSVLEAKTRVEYGAEPVSSVLASEMAKQAGRVFDFVVRALDGPDSG